MPHLRPHLRGLIVKLALFYVLLSLPCLALVEAGILLVEFGRFRAAVEGGSLARAAAAAAELAAAWPAAGDEARELALFVESLRLRLQRPRGGLLEDESYLLVELSAEPIAVAVLAPDGRVLARAPATFAWREALPSADADAWRAVTSAATMLPPRDDADFVRRALAPVRAADGRLRGVLAIELRLPLPWHRFLSDLSLEWPIVLGYLVVFGLASSLFLAAWVTRRLNRVARAAHAWSRGDFSDRIDDPARDELGRLSAQLDDMALQLRDLMRSRAELATLAERQRLARDLHDTVKQKAFALNLQIAGARRLLGEHAAAEWLEQAERLSRQIQQELDAILDELRAGGGISLAARLRERAREWAQTSGLALDLDVAELPGLAPPHAEALLRIADEALANVLRHSGASRVRVSLRRDTDAAELAIVDNGRGTTEDDRPGMGLANMRERALALPGGRFVLERAPESGTRVCVRFSLARSNPP